jgi:paraquat-inducible protein A
MAAELSKNNPNVVHVCNHCGQTQTLPTDLVGQRAQCFQCNATLHVHTPRGIQRTMALSIAALVLFIPANTLPILSMTKMGYQTQSTIWSGVVELWKDGTPGIAILVLLCSIVIPLAKIGGLFFLCATWRTRSSKSNTSLLRFIDFIGRWSMLDVFLVAILVALVKLGTIATINPEQGIVAFAGVVVLTLFASANFDSRLLWLQKEQ